VRYASGLAALAIPRRPPVTTRRAQGWAQIARGGLGPGRRGGIARDLAASSARKEKMLQWR